MAHDVFVSYSTKDKTVADAVVAGLESKGIRCWVAPRDILPGLSWGEAIIQAIETSKFMVIILSGNSNESKQVVREVERAVANNVIVIPFRIENIDPTGAMAYFLATEHWLDAITPPLENHINKLARTIQLFKEERPPDERKESSGVRKPPPEIEKKKALPLWVIIVGSGLVILSILAIIFLPGMLKNNNQLASNDTISTTTIPEITSTSTATPMPVLNVIGEYRTSGSTNGLFITENDMLYLASGTEGLIKISIGDPSNPKPIAIYQASNANDLVVDGEIVYYLSGDYGSKLVVSELGGDGLSTSFPNEDSHLAPTQSIYDVIIENGFAHVTGHNYWGIHDVSEPMYPIELWAWEPPSHSGNPCTPFVENDIAYIGCGWAGLFIFDISVPSEPELLSQFETSNWIIDIVVSERVAYLTLGESGLISLDVSDPLKPMIMDILTLPGFSSKLSISGDYAYVTYLKYEDNVLTASGVTAVNITDPEELLITASYDDLFQATDMEAVNDIIFITDELRGLLVLKIDFQ